MNFGLVTFGPVADAQTESDAYEPTVHTIRTCGLNKVDPLAILESAKLNMSIIWVEGECSLHHLVAHSG